MKTGFWGPRPAQKPVPKIEEIIRPSEDGKADRAPRVSLTSYDFTMGRHLGDGSFSQVVQAQRKGTDEVYALKIMDKRHIIREKKAEYIKNERNILDKLTYEGIVRLYFTFQDESNLYMGLECCEAGELFTQIKRKGKMTVEEARFYTAEVVLILEAIHDANVIHRDVKPENMLIASDGHLKLCDFGSAKIVGSARELIEGIDKEDGGKRKGSFVGTAEYVAPEVLNGLKVTKSVDFWALGCVLFQMLVSKPPFRGETEYLTFQKVVNFEMREFPDDFDEAAKDLILLLLNTDQDTRLGAGANGQAEIRAHPFFAGVDWDNLRQQAPPAVADMDPEEKRAKEAEEAEMAGICGLMDGGGDIYPEEELASVAGTTGSCEENGGVSEYKKDNTRVWMQVWSADYLLPGERMVEIAEVIPTINDIPSNNVMLVLTDQPRLFNVSMDAATTAERIESKDFGSNRKLNASFSGNPNSRPTALEGDEITDNICLDNLKVEVIEEDTFKLTEICGATYQMKLVDGSPAQKWEELLLSVSEELRDRLFADRL